MRLTRKEFDILHCLMSRAGRVVTYAKLLTAVWGADCREEVEYLRTFVRQLRKKIEDDPSNPTLSAHRCLRRLPIRRCADVSAKDSLPAPSLRRMQIKSPKTRSTRMRSRKCAGRISGLSTLCISGLARYSS